MLMSIDLLVHFQVETSRTHLAPIAFHLAKGWAVEGPQVLASLKCTAM